MGIEIKDLTGSMPTKRDLNDARQVVKKHVMTGILTLPPELALQLPNILRLLSVLEQTGVLKDDSL